MLAIRLGYRCRKILNAARVHQFLSPRRAFKEKLPKGTKPNTQQGSVDGGQKAESDVTDSCLSEQLQEALNLKKDTESLMCSLLTYLLLSRQKNNSLVNEIKKKDSQITGLKKELRLVELKKAAAEYKADTSQFRERDALMFMRHLRKLCLKLQRQLTRDRAMEICAVAALIKGAPDLNGLIELDTLLLHAGLIDQR
jgi:hypothetical protein